jgi:Ca2+-binding RTX toxin-like protein
MSANDPILNDLAATVTFDENTVNATPQLLDADVTFTNSDGDFNGGTLTVTGLLAEDSVSVRNQGTGGGQIGLSGANVTFGGVVIGTLAGGSGAALTITFNASATSEAIDALIQNLTYANASDSPTTSRTLVINVTDAAGNDLTGPPALVEQTGTANPFNGVVVGFFSTPTLADLDGDGDLDALVGEYSGALLYFENTGTAAAPVFTERTGTANPFNGVEVGIVSTPTFADLDGDGDLDALVGDIYGALNYFENTGTTSVPVFTSRTGTANPFNGVDVGRQSTPTLADLDNDGDLDALVGEFDGVLIFFENTGTVSAPVFTARTGGANPFNGVDLGIVSAPTFADMDGDGDLDVVVGERFGELNYFENTGTVSAPVFTARTGAANPFNGIDVSDHSAPTFADLDGDGDLDALVGEFLGNLNYFENKLFGFGGQAITVVVTPETDTLTGSEGADILVGTGTADRILGLGGDDDLSGGEGDDLLQGGNGNDFLSGGLGADILEGGSGDDTLYGHKRTLIEDGDAPSAPDFLFGGIGNDLLRGSLYSQYDGGAGYDSATVTADDSGAAIVFEYGGWANGKLYQIFVGGVASGSVRGIENLTFSAGEAADRITGGLGSDTLEGNGGADRLKGNDGDDVLDGGSHRDRLEGGLGSDRLTGGQGSDIFRFRSVEESRLGDEDLITDLSGGDRIDLSLIDADAGAAGDQAFLQVAAFTGAAGQLRLTYDAGAQQTTLAVDVNGDGLADFALLIAGEHLSAAGWVL